MNPFPLVLAELRRNPLGCAAVILLIAVGTALVIVVGAEERALRNASTRAAERFDLIIGAPGSPTQLVLTTIYLQPAALELLPAETLCMLADEPGAKSVAPVAVTDSYRGYTVVGTTIAFAAPAGVFEGRLWANRNEALVGADVELPLGHALRPAHGRPAENLLENHEHTLELTVVGRLRPSGSPWDRAIVVPIESLISVHGGDPENPRVPAVVVTPRTMADAYQLRAKYRQPSSVALFPAEVLLPLYSLLGDVRALFGAMAMAFEVLLILAVLLTIVAVLAGRRQSIGVLRALGAPAGFVISVVWLEGATLIFLGVASGAALAVPSLKIVSAYSSLQAGMAIEATIGVPEVALLGAILAGASALAALPSLPLLWRPVGELLRG